MDMVKAVKFSCRDALQESYSKSIDGLNPIMSNMVEQVLSELVWYGRSFTVSEPEMQILVQVRSVTDTIVSQYCPARNLFSQSQK